MKEEAGLRFPSKVDTWLVVFMCLALGGPAILALRAMASREATAWSLFAIAVPAALVVWIFTTTYYTVTDRELLVRSGPVRRRIALAAITSVTPTHNPLSSPALSLDRLDIRYGSSRVLVSPRDKEEFLRALSERAPSLSHAGLSDAQAGKSRVVPIAVALVLPVLIVAGVGIYARIEPVVETSGKAVSIQTWPARNIPVNDITGISLELSLPRVLRKQGGFDLFSVRRGRFMLERIGEGFLYVQSRQPPFLKLQTRSGVVYINYSEPARTRELYERLTRELNK